MNIQLKSTTFSSYPFIDFFLSQLPFILIMLSALYTFFYLLMPSFFISFFIFSFFLILFKLTVVISQNRKEYEAVISKEKNSNFARLLGLQQFFEFISSYGRSFPLVKTGSFCQLFHSSLILLEELLKE